MSKKSFIYIVVAVFSITLIFVYVFFLSGDLQNKKIRSNETDQTSAAPLGKYEPHEKAILSNNLANIHEEKNEKIAIDAETRDKLFKAMNEAKTWLQSHGYYDDGELAEYKGYDDSTLFSLVKTGDVKAITVLAQKKLEEKRIPEAVDLYTEGAIRGSIPSFQKLSEISLQLYRDAQRERNLNLANKLALDVGVWTLLGQKRDRGAVNEFIGLPTNINPLLPNLRTPEGIEATNREVEERYKILESKRLSLGLGKFDNSVTDAFNIIRSIDDKYYDPTVPQNDDRRLSDIYWK